MHISDEKESLSSIAVSLRILANAAKLTRRDQVFLPLFDRDGAHNGYIEYGMGKMLAVESVGAGWRVELLIPAGDRLLGRSLTSTLAREDAMAELEKIKLQLEKAGE